jgi:S-adenosyl methyltransferase
VAEETAAARPGPKLYTTVSHSARIWNYWLGGKDNYAVDRTAGDKVAAMLPSIVAQGRRTGRLGGGRSGIWPARRASASSWTSGPGCRLRIIPTRWPSGWLPKRGSFTPTTIR